MKEDKIKIRFTEEGKQHFASFGQDQLDAEYEISVGIWLELNRSQHGVKTGWFQYNDVTEFLGYNLSTCREERLAGVFNKFIFVKS